MKKIEVELDSRHPRLATIKLNGQVIPYITAFKIHMQAGHMPHLYLDIVNFKVKVNLDKKSIHVRRKYKTIFEER